MRALPIALLIGFMILASAVAAAPQLVSEKVTSTGSDTNSTYVFSVTYKGDAAAVEMSVVINGVARPMEELDPNDTDHTAGKVYLLETKLQSGVNRYSFRCADAEGNSTSTAVKMLLVKDAYSVSLTHLDVVFAVLMWLPFVVYFIYLARKVARTLERLEDRKDEGRPPETL